MGNDLHRSEGRALLGELSLQLGTCLPIPLLQVILELLNLRRLLVQRLSLPHPQNTTFSFYSSGLAPSLKAMGSSCTYKAER